MKVYLAHNFAARDILGPVVQQFTDAGHIVTSRWITDPEHVKENTAPDNAADDIADIDAADVVVLFIDRYGPSNGKGKWFEFGYAYGTGKTVFLVGTDTTCVFTHLQSDRIILVSCVEDLLSSVGDESA